jgi:hypothetical protein
MAKAKLVRTRNFMKSRRSTYARSTSRQANYGMFSLSSGLGKDDYDDNYFGLQESTFRTVTLSADFGPTNGWGGGGSYSYERYAGLQRSRSASPGALRLDPDRDWTVYVLLSI